MTPSLPVREVDRAAAGWGYILPDPDQHPFVRRRVRTEGPLSHTGKKAPYPPDFGTSSGMMRSDLATAGRPAAP